MTPIYPQKEEEEEKGKYLYRYDTSYFQSGIQNEVILRIEDGYVYLSLKRFLIVKETRAGVWIRIPWEDSHEKRKERFILLSAKKKWACPTPKEALISFMARKRRQIGILDYQLEIAQGGLKTAEELMKGEEG